MARHHPLKLYTSSGSSAIRPLTARLYNPIKTYSEASKGSTTTEHDHHMGEKAPSTAETFKNIADEKLREANQGVASQTFQKAYEGAEEATIGKSDDQDAVKNRIKGHEPGTDYRKNPKRD